ncbi:hypothetical protein [Streptomyces sp. WAC 01325]|uniref:hypothetical protein n=1 Tax=Streptomyces sp. WAC 01325 TaxID=2203202 RepID=UPI00163BD245|nr:hypothetical protein [Streptomyces sp. WAC 01325]
MTTTPMAGGRAVAGRVPLDDEYLGLLCFSDTTRTAIEFKHFTRRWTGTAGRPPKDYALKGHAATDLARLHFVRDMAGLERFCADRRRTFWPSRRKRAHRRVAPDDPSALELTQTPENPAR